MNNLDDEKTIQKIYDSKEIKKPKLSRKIITNKVVDELVTLEQLEFIDKFPELIDWDIISRRINFKTTIGDMFIERYHDKLNLLDCAVYNSSFDFEKYRDRLDWDIAY
jgi:hypothetical protein